MINSVYNAAAIVMGLLFEKSLKLQPLVYGLQNKPFH